MAIGLLQAADEVAVVLHGRALEGLAADAVALPRRDDFVGTPPGAAGVDRERVLVALGDAYPHTAIGTSTGTGSGIGVSIIIIIRSSVSDITGGNKAHAIVARGGMTSAEPSVRCRRKLAV